MCIALKSLTHVLVQEWNPTKEEFVARWSFWNKLPYTSRKELYIQVPVEGPDRQLLLLSIIVYAESSRGVWRAKCS